MCRLRDLLVVIMPVLVTGCAHYYWSKPGANAEIFYGDNVECARQALTPLKGRPDIVVVDKQRYRACLYARGYRREARLARPSDAWREIE